MPVYRVPLTGELLFLPTSYAPPSPIPGLSPHSVPISPERQVHGGTRVAVFRQVDVGDDQRLRHTDKVYRPRPKSRDHVPHHPNAWSEAPPLQRLPLPSGLGTMRRQRLSPLDRDSSSFAKFTAPPRKSITGGSIQTIVIYTVGDDEMAPYWRAYGKMFIDRSGGKGMLYGFKTQTEAASALAKLTDSDVMHVYFIGHGYEGKSIVRNGRELTRSPAFMLSGWPAGNGFHNGSDDNKNVTPEGGPLIEALAQHLSRDRMVHIAFLSCHSGTNKVLQQGIVDLVRKYAPGVAVTVLGYKEYYGVEKSANAPRAHLRASKAVPLSKDVQYYLPKDVPPTDEVVTYGDIYKGEDPLKDIAENPTLDPLFGL